MTYRRVAHVPPAGQVEAFDHIPLSRGMYALVDKADAELVAPFRWFVTKRRANWYAYRQIPGGRMEGMHQLLTGWALTDHINGDGLDNRRANLRQASHAQNSRNRRKESGTSSIYKGVTWNKKGRRWMARIRVASKFHHLGSFLVEADAARAYDAAAREHFGEFAALNFPLPGERGALAS